MLSYYYTTNYNLNYKQLHKYVRYWKMDLDNNYGEYIVSLFIRTS